MEHEEIEKAYSDLLVRYNGLATVSQQLQLENQQLKLEVAVLKTEKKKWDVDKEQQVGIVDKTVNGLNLLMQQQNQEIQELKNRLRKYEGD